MNDVYTLYPLSASITRGPIYPSGIMHEPDNPQAGDVRYDFSTHNLKVYNGCSWMPINTTVTISIDPSVTTAVDWVLAKQEHEKQLEKMASEVPQIADMVNQIKILNDQIHVFYNLGK
jgi:hypothetical protein